MANPYENRTKFARRVGTHSRCARRKHPCTKRYERYSVQAMLIIVVTWLVLIGGLCGVGALLARALGVRLTTIDSWLMAFLGRFCPADRVPAIVAFRLPRK